MPVSLALLPLNQSSRLLAILDRMQNIDHIWKKAEKKDAESLFEMA